MNIMKKRKEIKSLNKEILRLSKQESTPQIFFSVVENRNKINKLVNEVA